MTQSHSSVQSTRPKINRGDTLAPSRLTSVQQGCRCCAARASVTPPNTTLTLRRKTDATIFGRCQVSGCVLRGALAPQLCAQEVCCDPSTGLLRALRDGDTRRHDRNAA
jgi:hypothetical protein